LAATGHVQALTVFETTGWFGVMETAEGSPLPDAFPSAPGNVFPIYHALADLAEYRGAAVQRLISSDPLRVAGLALVRNDGRRRCLIANLTGEALELDVDWAAASPALRRLDETTAREAMRAPEKFRTRAGEVVGADAAGRFVVRLRPYALATVDA
jgi:hypothetical protein